MGRKLVENVLVTHPSDGESVVDVASHATEEKEQQEVVISQNTAE